MLGWFQALMPKEGRFFDLFDGTGQTLRPAPALRQVLEGGEAVPDCAAWPHEQEADDITREVLLAVRRTFITPFDRGDIKDLITSMDDAIDQMHKTAKAITLFEHAHVRPRMREMGDDDRPGRRADARGGAAAAVACEQNAARLNAIAEEITRIEERPTSSTTRACKALYHGHGASDPMAFIVGAEIYDHLEKVVDRFEDVANGSAAS